MSLTPIIIITTVLVFCSIYSFILWFRLKKFREMAEPIFAKLPEWWPPRYWHEMMIGSDLGIWVLRVGFLIVIGVCLRLLLLMLFRI